MDYFIVHSWIDRRIEETRHIYIGKLYPWWRRLPARKLFSNRLVNFMDDNWHLSFNGEIIEIGKSYKHKFRF